MNKFFQQSDTLTDLTPIVQTSLQNLLISSTNVGFEGFLLADVYVIGYVGVAATGVLDGTMLFIGRCFRYQVSVLGLL